MDGVHCLLPATVFHDYLPLKDNVKIFQLVTTYVNFSKTKTKKICVIMVVVKEGTITNPIHTARRNLILNIFSIQFQ